MNTETLKANLAKLGVGNVHGLNMRTRQDRKLFIRLTLTRLGDVFNPETGELRPSGFQKGNNAHPLYNETMAELLQRWFKT